MAKNKKRKVRVDFRKNRTQPPRRSDWTRRFADSDPRAEEAAGTERISGKGDLTRRRTVRGEVLASAEQAGFAVDLEVDTSVCRRGRVLSVHGLTCLVEDDTGQPYHCAVRRLLKTLATDQRHVVVTGDRVWFRPVPTAGAAAEGIVERVEPRYGTLCRQIRGRQQVMVANIDQLLIVASAAQPRLKPNLIDRLLVAAEKGGVQPVICINKIDLVAPASLQPLAGVYAQMGYPVLLLSAATGAGLSCLRRRFAAGQSVVAGQSGVGKSSLLNAVDPGLQLTVREVSEETEKGRHTTTTARLLRLAQGGHVVDTPGIRQFRLWDVVAEEVCGYFRDLRPFVSRCRFPDCTHTHEESCAIKDAVADGRLDQRRYESYCHMLLGEED